MTMYQPDQLNYLHSKCHSYNPFEIANYLGYMVRWFDLGSQKGFTTSYKGKIIILMNNALIDSPEKYSVMAHELGHAIYHVGLETIYICAFNGKGKLEHEANVFASQLLLKFYEEQTGEKPDTVQKIETAFKISESMASNFYK